MVKSFISGLLLGSVLTLLGGVFVGPTITFGDINSLDGKDRDQRYDLRIDEKDGLTRYSILDIEKGVATIASSDGKTVIVKADTVEDAK